MYINIFEAIRAKDLEGVKHFLEKKVDLSLIEEESQLVPLGLAIDLGLDDISELLMSVEEESDVNAQETIPLIVNLNVDKINFSSIVATNIPESQKQNKFEPIAIIGASGYFPGSGENLQGYWELLSQGKDASREIPKARFNMDEDYSDTRDVVGKSYVKRASFLTKAVDEFDANFFNISPKEATFIDPQHRLVLECVWEALENAGIDPSSLKHSDTSIFMGALNDDYSHLLSQGDVIHHEPGLIGGGLSFLSGRVAYWLGCQGPTMTIETACSSSLVALHQACQSIRNNESKISIVGGVNLLLTVNNFVLFSNAQMLSPDGKCKAFDAAADGYGRGEGCGIVILKSLSQAQADNDNILAVIRSSAVNQDGPSSGITVPNGPAQEKLIRTALAQANLSPNDIDYIEAHGTGTSLGDPIEFNAIKNVFTNTTREQPLIVGTAKTYVGHLEAAAGMAGLIKTVLSLQHNQIPKLLHFKKLNPNIELNTNIQLPLENQAWKSNENRVRRAGISSFGASGTNAHVIIEEAPQNSLDTILEDARAQLIVFTGKQEKAREGLKNKYQSYLEDNTERLSDIAYTSLVGRSHFTYRGVVIASNKDELKKKLASDEIIRGHIVQKSKVIFLFTGQGSQYVKMGYELYEEEPLFKETLDECARLLKEELPRPFYSVLFGDQTALINQTQYAQPLLFALEYSLAQFWISLGIIPQQMIGHSVGELVAATIAGVMTLPDAIKLIAARARLMQSLPEQQGGMLVLKISYEETLTLIQGTTLGVAGINAPKQTVVSGDLESLHALEKKCEKEKITATRLSVSHAFHSQHMLPMIEVFRKVAASINYQVPQIPLISTVTGQKISEINADYWCKQLLQAVNYLGAIKTSASTENQIYLEVGPAPTLITLGQQCLERKDNLKWCFSLKSGQSNRMSVLATLAQCYVSGVEIDWQHYYRRQPYHYHKIMLPTYAFQKQRYWIEGLEQPRKVQQTNVFIPTLNFHWSNDLLPNIYENIAKYYPLKKLNQGQEYLEQLALSYILDCFHQAGWSYNVGDHINSGEAQQIFSVLNIHTKLFHQLLWELAKEGILEQQQPENYHSSNWIVKRSLPSLEEVSHLRQKAFNVLENYAELSIERHLLSRCGKALYEILIGNTLPLGLLFPQDEVEAQLGSATALYQNGVGIEAGNRILTESLSQVIKTVTPGKTIRILEIGAGTGGTTRKVIAMLNQNNVLYEYTYTDISNGFFLGAKEIFGEEKVKYQLLNIEQDPKAQSFEQHDYDIIIAANILHATQNLPKTLQHTRQLLVPEGVLLLLEISQSSRFLDLTFGLLDGWWRFNDELRVDHAVLSSTQWQEALKSAGFKEVSYCNEPAIVVFAQANLLGLEYVKERESRDENTTFANFGKNTGHPLLGQKLPLVSKEIVYHQLLSHSVKAMLSEHQVLHYPLMPGTGFIEMLLAAIKDYLPGRQVELQKISIKESLFFNQEKITLQLIITPKNQHQAEIAIYSLPSEQKDLTQAKLHVSGQLQVIEAQKKPVAFKVEEILKDCDKTISKKEFYRITKQHGYHYQGMFENVVNLHDKAQSRLIELALPSANTNDYIIHPALFDGALQGELINLEQGMMILPTGMEKVRIYEPKNRVPAYAYHQDRNENKSDIFLLSAEGEVIAEVIGLTAKAMPRKTLHKLLRKQTGILPKTNYYGIEWEKQELKLNKPQTEQPPRLLYLLDNKEQVEDCLLQMSEPSSAFLLPDGNYYSTSQGWKKRTLSEILKEEWSGILYSWSIKTAESEIWNKDKQKVVITELLSFTQALTKNTTPLMLKILTQGAQSIKLENITDLSQSTLNGFCKTLAMEYPQWSVSHIDLDANKTFAEQLPTIIEEFKINSKETDLEVCYRGEQRFVSRACFLEDQHVDFGEQLQKPIENPLLLNSNASYLITGGLSGLGLATAELFVNRGAKQLILVSRRMIDKDTEAQLNTWRNNGVDIQVKQIDISDEEQVKQLLTTIISECLPLKGIIHSAGLLQDALLVEQDWQHMEYVFKPKVYGAWYLHKWSKEFQIELDYFVMYSSTASFLGNIGQANHSSANAFMDGLVHYRRNEGLKAQTIHWGAWGEIGTAAIYKTQHEKRGIQQLSVVEGIEALERILLDDRLTETAIVSMDWRKLNELSSPSIKRFINELTVNTKLSTDNNEWMQGLLKSSIETRQAKIEEKLKLLVEQVSQIKTNDIDVQRGFAEMGFDSLMTVELRNRVQKLFGGDIILSTTLVFDYPTIQELSKYLLTQLHFEEQVESIVEEKLLPQSHAVEGKVEAIAIIGASGYFPGSGESLSGYWELLSQDKDASSEIPKHRFSIDEEYSDTRNVVGKSYVKRASFLAKAIDEFDASFFNISPKDAKLTDPQHRLLLECVWEALENAGVDPHSLKYSDTSVFMGAMNQDYADILTVNDALHKEKGLLGIGLSVLSGRIAYWLGCQGPTMTIDTACSSSLVALHQACQSIRNGESHLSIVGGVNLMLTANNFVAFSNAQMLSPDGKCKAFDASADGYGRGEGSGVVILKPLSQAQADNDNILAVIRGSAVNQDGPSSSLTVPNGPAQEKLIKTALTQANLSPNDIDYIEAHGTGTSLGDPIELNAITNIFAKETREQPLVVGTAKTYIGHLEAAAGMAGLIKIILSLQHQQIPKLLHFKQLNPKITLNKNIQLPIKAQKWEVKESHIRRAGISSFGASGTNAHVIIEEAHKQERILELTEDENPQLIVLSAKTAEALQALKDKYIAYLQITTDRLQDIAYTSAVGRAHFSYRFAIVAQTKKEALGKLQNLTSLNEDEKSEFSKIVRAYLAGEQINWQVYYTDRKSKYRKVHLPTYAFQRQPYWVERLKKRPTIGSFYRASSHYLNVTESTWMEDLMQLSIVLRPAKIERKLKELVEHISQIKIDEIDNQQSFADMGFDSLMTTELRNQLHHIFSGQVTLSINDIAEHPTIEQLNHYITEEFNKLKTTEEIEKEELVDPAIVPIYIDKNKPMLFLIHDISSFATVYQRLLPALKNQFSVYGVNYPNSIVEDEDENMVYYSSLEALAKDYIKKIKTVLPQGPYYLGGWSLGGTISLEITKQLQKAGEKVSFLLLLDTFYLPYVDFEDKRRYNIFITDLLAQLDSRLNKKSSLLKRVANISYHLKNLFDEYKPTKINPVEKVFFIHCQGSTIFNAEQYAKNFNWSFFDLFNGLKYYFSNTQRIYLRDIACGHFEIFYKSQLPTLNRLIAELLTESSSLSYMVNDDEQNLWLAAKKGSTYQVKRILAETEGQLLNVQDIEGKSLLHRVVEAGHITLANYLVSQNIDLNLQDDEHKTALEYLPNYGMSVSIPNTWQARWLKTSPLTILDKGDVESQVLIHMDEVEEHITHAIQRSNAHSLDMHRIFCLIQSTINKRFIKNSLPFLLRLSLPYAATSVFSITQKLLMLRLLSTHSTSIIAAAVLDDAVFTVFIAGAQQLNIPLTNYLNIALSRNNSTEIGRTINAALYLSMSMAIPLIIYGGVAKQIADAIGVDSDISHAWSQLAAAHIAGIFPSLSNLVLEGFYATTYQRHIPAWGAFMEAVVALLSAFLFRKFGVLNGVGLGISLSIGSVVKLAFYLQDLYHKEVLQQYQLFKTLPLPLIKQYWHDMKNYIYSPFFTFSNLLITAGLISSRTGALNLMGYAVVKSVFDIVNLIGLIMAPTSGIMGWRFVMANQYKNAFATRILSIGVSLGVTAFPAIILFLISGEELTRLFISTRQIPLQVEGQFFSKVRSDAYYFIGLALINAIRLPLTTYLNQSFAYKEIQRIIGLCFLVLGNTLLLSTFLAGNADILDLIGEMFAVNCVSLLLQLYQWLKISDFECLMKSEVRNSLTEKGVDIREQGIQMQKLSSSSSQSKVISNNPYALLNREISNINDISDLGVLNRTDSSRIASSTKK